MPEPGPDDWLARHSEKPQSFQDYLRADRNVPNPQRNVIYLLPVGGFPATAPPLAQLATIVHAFFMLEVKTLPAVNVGNVTAKARINEGTKKRQLFAPDVLGWLRQAPPRRRVRTRGGDDGGPLPEPSWNFVFGMAVAQGARRRAESRTTGSRVLR